MLGCNGVALLWPPWERCISNRITSSVILSEGGVREAGARIWAEAGNATPASNTANAGIAILKIPEIDLQTDTKTDRTDMAQDLYCGCNQHVIGARTQRQ